jgi:hypothetical protein
MRTRVATRRVEVEPGGAPASRWPGRGKGHAGEGGCPSPTGGKRSVIAAKLLLCNSGYYSTPLGYSQVQSTGFFHLASKLDLFVLCPRTAAATIELRFFDRSPEPAAAEPCRGFAPKMRMLRRRFGDIEIKDQPRTQQEPRGFVNSLRPVGKSTMIFVALGPVWRRRGVFKWLDARIHGLGFLSWDEASHLPSSQIPCG